MPCSKVDTNFRMAYLEFNDAGALNKAFELNGSQLGEYSLTVDEAKPRSDNRDSRDSGRGRGRGSGGRGRGAVLIVDAGVVFDSGRGGRGGRGRGTPFKPSVTSAASVSLPQPVLDIYDSFWNGTTKQESPRCTSLLDFSSGPIFNSVTGSKLNTICFSFNY
ncbi:hypothetical protein NC653_019784 [Populus alba x Populus x berolinensis]|uniref:RRM domain-containing protein n=1 Tax=Populus alba x Populus x berolinensis TaxID=444605 RepID=A0AAD6QJV1_9ROSI|nr:hypothetical protein NC653_019784 [Populus alba x Populus x berolinensis]